MGARATRTAAGVVVTAMVLMVAALPPVRADDAPDAFPVLPLPLGISPSTGPSTGGTAFTISGSQFQQGATVTFGGVSAGSVVVQNPSTLNGISPPGTLGHADVAVANPGSAAVLLLNNTWSYTAPAPTVTALSPQSGPASGGTIVTVSGSGFADGTSVAFGVAFASVQALTDSEITVVAPPGSVGDVPVTVSVPGATAVVAPDPFSYTPADPPVVSAVDPNHGPTTGGTPVTIAGSGFLAGAVVDFDDESATQVTVVSDTQITAMTPANTMAGPVPVTVTNPDGQSETLHSGFTYDAVPTPVPASISPHSGSTLGGARFWITGASFDPDAIVTFAGTKATDLTVSGDGARIEGTIPAGSAGVATVTVTNPGQPEASASLPPGSFTYVAQDVTITGVAPDAGGTAGRTRVSITGSGFVVGSTRVAFGGVAAVVVSVTPTVIQVSSPPHAAGAVDVEVDVTSAAPATRADAFTYLAGPEVTSVSPVTGSTAGGTPITIVGSGFGAGTTVAVGGAPASDVQIVSSTTVTASTPSGPVGSADLSVTVPGLGTTTLPDAFTYADTPTPVTVASMSPSSGPTTGGTQVVIIGTGFAAGMTATLGGSSVTSTSVTATRLVGLTPAGPAGSADLVVSVPGQVPVTVTGAFDYVSPDTPTVTGVQPASGPQSGGTLLTISGTGFMDGDTVDVGGNAGTQVVVQGTTTIVVTAPSGQPGAADVTVTAPSGAAATLPGAYTYLATSAPTIASIAPAQGPTAGGTLVTVTGTGFSTTTTVTIGGAPATDITWASATTLVVTTPPGLAGPASVVVANTGFPPAMLSGGFDYVAAPTFTAITPSSGPVAGGTSVDITGTGFLPDATVAIDGVAATDVTIDGPTRITATVPADPSDAGGAADVVVANIDGQFFTAPNAYTYVPQVSVTGVSPNTGPAGGGTVVTITGVGFVPGASVTFGGSPASDVTVTSSTAITATTPAADPGWVSVTVTVPNALPATLANSFDYRGALSVTSVSPGTGPQSGGSFVTVGGTGFDEGATVTFGGVDAADVVFLGDTELTAVTPPGAGGVVAVSVSVDGNSATLPSGFVYATSPAPDPDHPKPVDPARPDDSSRPGDATPTPDHSGAQGDPTHHAEQAQRAKVTLPKRLHTRGTTALVHVPLLTNADQHVRVQVTGHPTKTPKGKHSHTPAVQVVRASGTVSVWLAGEEPTTVTVTLTAPATGDFAAYRLTRTYRNSAAH